MGMVFFDWVYNIAVYRGIVNPESPSLTSFDRNNGSNSRVVSQGVPDPELQGWNCLEAKLAFLNTVNLSDTNLDESLVTERFR
jgi:hypothetical protein